MLIVVEGCDGTGKTTLVDLLEQRIIKNFAYAEVVKLHYGVPERHPLEEYELDLQDYRPGTGRHLLIDRLHWGEAIYGPIYRGKSKLGYAGMRHIDMFLRSVGGVIIWLDLPVGELRRRLTKRGEDYLKSDDVEKVCDMYLEQFQESIADRAHFSQPCDQVDADDILAYAQCQERKTYELADEFPTYIGPTNPRYLLLGDTRNHPTEQEHRLAFVPYENTSGRFLLEALSPTFLQECGIANACEEDLTELTMRLHEPRVVALGTNAHKACVEHDLRHSWLPHPQYVRRFHHLKQTQYGDMIIRAATSKHDCDWHEWPKGVTCGS